MLALFKRFSLFVIVNLLVITTLAITWSLISAYFGLDSVGYLGLLVLCAIFGMGGAFISLLMSKKMAQWMMKVKIIDPRTTDPQMRELVQMVYQMSLAAGLPKTPDVGVYQGDEVNAFATGPSKRNSLVAVSTGLLHRLGKGEVEAVVGHEIAHIANGDMVTMTLLQGVINTLVMFVAHIVARIVASQLDERFSWVAHIATIIILQIVLGLLGSIVVNYFSRKREFRADAGGARLAGRDKMISALRALANTQELVNRDQEALATLKIAGVKKRSRLAQLVSTHPSLQDRIYRLERGR